MSKDENPFSEYFNQNERIIVVLSLFCGFIFTSITLLLTTLQNRGGILGQGTILFLTLIFYFSLYALLDNLEMGFHYIKNIPPLTLKIRPFISKIFLFEPLNPSRCSD